MTAVTLQSSFFSLNTCERGTSCTF